MIIDDPSNCWVSLIVPYWFYSGFPMVSPEILRHSPFFCTSRLIIHQDVDPWLKGPGAGALQLGLDSSNSIAIHKRELSNIDGV